MDFTYKLRNLLLLLIISLILLACSGSQNYEASANLSQWVSTEQLAVTIKKEIHQDPLYRKGKIHYQAKQYTSYVSGIIEQVKNKKISEDDARNLLIRTYRQFKAGNYNFKNENLLNEAPTTIPQETPLQIPRYIPEKPGAL